jgi:hypothetical protein
VLAETIDVDSTRLDGGGTPGKWQTQIDPKKLPMAMVDGKCVAVKWKASHEGRGKGH